MPQVNIQSPTANRSYHVGERVRYSARVSAADRIAKVEGLWTNPAGHTFSIPMSDVGGGSFEGSIVLKNTTPDGRIRVVRVRATDAGGNMVESPSVQVRVVP